MGDSTELSYRRILFSLLLSLFFLLLIGCKGETAFVFSDPQVEMINNGSWAPASRLFALKAQLKGFRIHSTIIESDVNIFSLLSEFETQPDIIVLSPFHAMNIGTLPENGPRYIIAGGRALDSEEKVLESVAINRRKAMREAGKICAEIALSGQGRAYALFDTDTEEKKLEKIEFFSGFIDVAGEQGILIMEDLAETGMEGLPPDFSRHSEEDDILAFFAGPLNIIAITESNEDYGLLITEYIEASEAWVDRLVLSLEDNPKELKKALLKQMGSPENMPVRDYPARIFKGKAFRRR